MKLTSTPDAKARASPFSNWGTGMNWGTGVDWALGATVLPSSVRRCSLGVHAECRDTLRLQYPGLKEAIARSQRRPNLTIFNFRR